MHCGKFLEMGIPDHLTCLLRNLYADQEATVRTGDGTMDWFQIGKGTHQGYVLSHCFLTYMQSISWEMPGLMKHELESRLPRAISITSDVQITSPSWQKAEELKSLLMKVKEKSEKAGLKLNIHKTKIMTSGPITSWQIDGKHWRQWQTFSWVPKSTVDSECSHEIKRRLLLGRKAMTNLDSILKNKDITLPTKVGIVRAMVFLVVMYGVRAGQ